MEAIHEWVGPTGITFKEVRHPSGTYYREGTPKEVVEGIELARTEGFRVRIHLGDRQTGRDWLEESDTFGYIGRTMGPLKVPILLQTPRSIGGGAISLDCIVRLVLIHSTSSSTEVYRHPKWTPPLVLISPCVTKNAPELRFVAYVYDKEQARFETLSQVERWAKFIRGERLKR